MENTQIEKVGKAGAIVLHSDGTARVALIFRGKEKDWSFPKGHIESGEEPLAACIREVKEEIGLEVDIIDQLPNNEYLHKSGNKIVTYMYLVRSKGREFVIEKPSDKIEWINIDEVKNKLGYDNLKQYFSKILPIVKKRLKR